MFPAQGTACFSRLSKGSDFVSAAVCGIQDTDRDPLLPLGSMPSRVPVLYDLELPDDFTSQLNFPTSCHDIALITSCKRVVFLLRGRTSA